MKDTSILLLVVAALLALGGFLVTVGIDSGRLTSVATEIAGCRNVLADWDAVVCDGVADGRYTAQDVLANPSWDWTTIGAGQVRTGMTPRMVEAAWGSPEYINLRGDGANDEEWAANGHLLGFRSGTLETTSRVPTWSVYDLLAAAIGSAADYELRTYGKQAFIVGEVREIASELDGTLRIDFEHSEGWDEVQCFIASDSQVDASTLRIGQSVVLLGVGDGLGLFGPTFRSCRVFSK